MEQYSMKMDIILRLFITKFYGIKCCAEHINMEQLKNKYILIWSS